jgi:hypothetical protein
VVVRYEVRLVYGVVAQLLLNQLPVTVLLAPEVKSTKFT